MDPHSSRPKTQPAAQPPETVQKGGESLLTRFKSWFWGYDFFISYRWSSGGPYAVNLAERLRDRGYECFLDRAEFAVGDDWRKDGERALRNTQRLVVVATTEAIRNSEPVRHEVEAFTARSRRVIPIVFGRRFTDKERLELPTLKFLSEGTIDIVEQEDRLHQGPSAEVLEKLIQAHRLLRRRSVRSIVVSTALLVLAIAAAVAFTFWRISEHERAEATRRGFISLAQALAAQSVQQKEDAHRDELAVLLADQAYRFNHENQGDRLSEIDQALRRILSAKDFSIELGRGIGEFGSVAVDSSGRFLAAGIKGPVEGKVVLWDLRGQRQFAELPSPGGGIQSLDFNPSGDRLAAGTDDGALAVWNVAEDSEPDLNCKIETHDYQPIRSISLSRDGLWVASVGEDQTVQVHATDSRCGVVHTFGPFTALPWSVDFSDQRLRLAAGFSDGSAVVWNLESEQPERAFAAREEGPVRAVAMDPEGKWLASASDAGDGSVRIWQIGRTDPGSSVITEQAGSVSSLSFDATGLRLAAAAADGNILLWDFRRGHPFQTVLEGHEGYVSSIDFGGNGSVLASASVDSQAVRLWYTAAPLGEPTSFHNSAGEAGEVKALVLQGTGPIMASADGRDARIRLWNPDDGSSPPRILEANDDSMSSRSLVSVALSLDGSLVAAGSSDLFNGQNEVLVWNIRSPDRPPAVGLGESPIVAVAFNPVGDLLATAGEFEKGFQLWHVRDSSLEAGPYINLPAEITCMCSAASGKGFALGLRDETVRLWSTKTSNEMAVFDQRAVVTALWCVSSRPSLASGGEDGSIRVWNLDRGDSMELSGQDASVTSLAGDLEARILVSGGADGMIRVWDLQHPGHSPVVISTPWPRVKAVVVDPDGQWIAGAGNDTRVLAWDRTDQLLRKAKNRLWRKHLNPTEWTRFIPEGIPFPEGLPAESHR